MAKYRAKTEFGADKEADKVLSGLPRKATGPLNGRVFIDAAGRLCIYLDGGGALSLRENDLSYVRGDEIFTI